MGPDISQALILLPISVLHRSGKRRVVAMMRKDMTVNIHRNTVVLDTCAIAVEGEGGADGEGHFVKKANCARASTAITGTLSNNGDMRQSL